MTAFRKYHGLGNDFVLIDNRHSNTPSLTPTQSAAICDRHTGVGADGVIFLLPPTATDSHIAMRLYNSDGSEPEMCGNGIRCLARFAADLGVPSGSEGAYRVDTLAGVIVPRMRVDGQVTVDMGAPILAPTQIPTTLPSANADWVVDGKTWITTAVSMGNPHAVTFVDESTYADLDARLESVGPLFETSNAFPAKTNTEFVVAAPGRMKMLVWERGAGRTLACGTGACAVVVAAVLTGRARRDEDVTVQLPGGDLVIRWDESDNGSVFMTGPAEFVYSGVLAETPVMAAA